MLEDREVATTARMGAHQGFAKVVRLVDWAVDWGAIFHPDGHPKLCRKPLILHGIFVPFVLIVQVLQQNLPLAEVAVAA